MMLPPAMQLSASLAAHTWYYPFQHQPQPPQHSGKGEMPRHRWEQYLFTQKNHRPCSHCAWRHRHQKPPCLVPNFQYQPRNLMSWPELSYRFQSHYIMLCESLPNPMTTLPLHQMMTSMTHFTLPTQQKSHQCSPRSTRCPPAD